MKFLLLAVGVIVIMLLLASKADGRPTPLTALHVSQQTFEPVEQQQLHWNFTGCQHDVDDFRFASGSGTVAGAATVWAGCVNADWGEHLISVTACDYKGTIRAIDISLQPPADGLDAPWPYSRTRIPYVTGAYTEGRRQCRWACIGTPDYDRIDPRLVELQPDPHRLVGVRTDIWVTITASTGNRGTGMSANILPVALLPNDGGYAYTRCEWI